MSKFLLFIHLFICFPLFSKEQEHVLDFVDKTEYSLHPYLYYCENLPEHVTIQQIIALKKQHKFKAWNKESVFNVGYPKGICCVNFKVYNRSSDHQTTLFCIYDDIRKVKLYQKNQDTLIHFPAQSYYTHNTTRLVNQRMISYRLSIPPKETVEFYVLLDNRDANLYTPMDFGTFEYFFKWEVDYHWSYALYIGMMIFALFCTIIFAFLIKKRLFIYYSLFIFGWLTVFLQEEFFLGYFLNESLFIQFSKFIQSPFFLLALLCNYKVIRHLEIISFRSDKTEKWLNRLFLILIFYILVTEIIAVFFPEQHQLLQWLVKITNVLNTLVEGFILIKIVIDLVLKRKLQTIYYLFISIIYTIGCFNFNLNSMAIINLNIFKPNGIVIGVSIEIVYFAIVIIKRQIKIIRNENELKLTIEKERVSKQQAIIDAELAERKRLAYEVHDHLGGLMSALKLSFTGNDFIHTYDLIEQANKDVRNLAHQLMPLNVESLGLNKALDFFCKEVNSSKFQIDTQLLANDDVLNLSQMIECYRILTELVNNASKHSTGNHCIVKSEKLDGKLMYSVTDNGEKIDNLKDGIGLNSIRRRLDLLKSELFFYRNISGHNEFHFFISI